MTVETNDHEFVCIATLYVHKNRRRFECQNSSHVALFSAATRSCFQRRWMRHNAIGSKSANVSYLFSVFKINPIVAFIE